jgi:hypothetical protein
MKYLLSSSIFAIFMAIASNSYSQTTVTWRTDGPSDGSWLWGSTCESAGDGQWFYDLWTGFRQAPDCFGNHDVFFRGNGINTMNLNTRNFGVRRISFESGATEQRTLNASGSNRLFTHNVSGTPKIENYSTTTHIFNAPITFNATTEINPINGNLQINQEIDNNSFFLDVFGSQTLVLDGDLSGTGGLAVKQAATKVEFSTNAKSYTGNTVIENGLLSSSVNIASGNIQVQDAATFRATASISVRGLEVQSGGTLEVNEGFTLTINGTFNVANGATISAETWRRIIIGSSGTVTSATPTGIGTATLSRQITGAAGWRTLSSPVGEVAFDAITNLNLQGFGDGFDVNVYTHWSRSAWVAATTANQTTTAGQGFLWYYFANSNAGSVVDPTISVTGTPGSDVQVSVNNGTGNEQYTLIGNPYGYTVDLTKLVGKVATSQAVVSYWQADPNLETKGTWISSSTNNNRLGVWQGAMLQSNTGQTHVIIPNATKTDATATFYKENGASDRLLQLELDGISSDGQVRTRDLAAVVYFNQGASFEWDAFDASKLLPLSYNAATLGFWGERSGERNLQSQLSLPMELDGPVEIPVQLDVQNMGGTFTVSLADFRNIPDSWNIVFVDTQTGSETDLRNASYVFEHNAMAKIARSDNFTPEFEMMSVADEARFMLRLNGAGVSTSTEIGTDLPVGVELSQNYPNPFNPATQIRFAVPVSGEVRLAVYDLLGREVAVLVNGGMSAGSHTVNFDAASLGSGVYVYRLDAAGQTLTRKMTLVK